MLKNVASKMWTEVLERVKGNARYEDMGLSKKKGESVVVDCCLMVGGLGGRRRCGQCAGPWPRFAWCSVDIVGRR